MLIIRFPQTSNSWKELKSSLCVLLRGTVRTTPPCCAASCWALAWMRTCVWAPKPRERHTPGSWPAVLMVASPSGRVWRHTGPYFILFYFIIVVKTTSVTQLLLLLPCPSGIKPESLQQLGHMRKCSILLILMCLIPLTKDVCAYLGKKMKLKL